MNLKKNSFLSRDEHKKVTTGHSFLLKNPSDFMTVFVSTLTDLVVANKVFTRKGGRNFV